MSSFNNALFDEASAPKKARIEVIPLIDVVFFLLATFVLFTLSLNKIVAIPLDLPHAVPQAAKTESEDSVTLQVSGDGTVYWNKEPMDKNGVPDRLRYYKATSPNPRVLLTGDDKASYGDTIWVLDQIHAEGIEQVAIETTPRSTGR